LSGGEKLIVV